MLRLLVAKSYWPLEKMMPLSGEGFGRDFILFSPFNILFSLLLKVKTKVGTGNVFWTLGLMFFTMGFVSKLLDEMAWKAESYWNMFCL
ncbi:hypothetical protein V6N13_117892 [Hibiscus sabdariffa]